MIGDLVKLLRVASKVGKDWGGIREIFRVVVVVFRMAGFVFRMV